MGNRCFGVNKQTEAAAPASPGGGVRRRSLPGKCTSVVLRTSNPNPATSFAWGRSRQFPMPCYVDVSGIVSSNGPATIETERLSHEVALRFKAGTLIAQPRVEHWGAGLSRLGIERSARFGK